MKLNKSRLNKALKIAQETYESNRSDVEERKDRELFFRGSRVRNLVRHFLMK